ncbi:MAG: DUF115 domain-containing protein, partial [Phycisphaerales bacterium]|nr:DUF115 domain-containing protein [Phycisphaerales bacterium]
MTTTVTAAGPDTFTRNMRIIEKRWPHLARQIHAASPAVDFELMMTGQGVPTAQYAGRWLASRHRPLEEATRLADSIDFVEKATVVIAGFGAGYHVGEIAGRMARSGIVVVFEPDVALLRRVFDVIDHSAWLENTNVIIITDPDDRGLLGQDLQKLESILLLGTAFVEPPAHRERLATSYPVFLRNFREHVTSAETTLMTTLMRSYDTIRNLLMNVDTYALGDGIDDLHDRLIGAPAVVVSAGPSLAKTVRALAEPGVRDRCIIVAVQTALRPLLDAGVRPHFITALDYHEISRRFYEELDPQDVEHITLIADPKVHPYVIRAWTGPVRCCSSRVLDSILGALSRPMGELPAGATVAHLALYAAVHLGCTRIALTGQDLGFPDGLYYAPGTAIHRVWGPELNTFNTIAMMEWERIVRMRRHLHKATDVDGKSIYTDTQMLTYLRHFEADFSRYRSQGIEIFDATEGGVRKQYTEPIALKEFLDRHATTPLPELPSPSRTRDPGRRRALHARLHEIRRDVQRVRQLARAARERINAMLEQHENQAFVNEQIEEVHRLRSKVEDLPFA